MEGHTTNNQVPKKASLLFDALWMDLLLVLSCCHSVDSEGDLCLIEWRNCCRFEKKIKKNMMEKCFPSEVNLLKCSQWKSTNFFLDIITTKIFLQYHHSIIINDVPHPSIKYWRLLINPNYHRKLNEWNPKVWASAPAFLKMLFLSTQCFSAWYVTGWLEFPFCFYSYGPKSFTILFESNKYNKILKIWTVTI